MALLTVLATRANYNDVMLALRYIYVLALVIWLGGMIAVGLVAAPAIFYALEVHDPTGGRVAAGAAFGEVLRRFHVWTYASAAVMLIALGTLAALGSRPVAFRARLAIVVTMLAIALFSGVWVSGRIERLQARIDMPVQSLPATDPRRTEFGRLHGLSTGLMLVNILGGLVLLYWEARE